MTSVSRRIALIVTTAVATVVAQTQAPVQFDVASVLPNTLNDRIVTIEPGPGGRFSARGYSLKLLIQHAYGVKGFQISGGPAWLDEDRFDVVARGAANATPGQRKLMLQALLAERFGLKLHKTQRQMDGFELVVNGNRPKVKVSPAKEENADMIRKEDGALGAHGIAMPSFAKALGAYLARPVVDKTGLTGFYDFRISWSDRPGPDGTPGVPLITALRDQLGLKVSSARVSAEMLVIDHAEKASAN